MLLTKPTTKKKTYTNRINNELFVKCWVKTRTLSEVAEHFGITEQAASNKATHLRKRGVKLPKKPRNVVKNSEVSKLNKLIERLLG